MIIDTFKAFGSIVGGLLLMFLIALGAYKMHKLITYVMPNDEIILETKKCEEAGLDAVAVRNGMSYEIVGIQCSPKEK